MNPGIDNIEFKIKLDNRLKSLKQNQVFWKSSYGYMEVIQKPKRLWFKEILYYLSLGLYDRRGYIYKVKIVKQ